MEGSFFGAATFDDGDMAIGMPRGRDMDDSSPPAPHRVEHSRDVVVGQVTVIGCCCCMHLAIVSQRYVKANVTIMGLF